MEVLDMSQKYAFSWSLLGDIKAGRPNLGNTTRLEVYRLMQFTLRDAIEQKYGSTAADEVFYAAGHTAGQQFYKQLIGAPETFDGFVHRVQETLVEMGIGILRIEKADLENGTITLTVSEDLDCSGLPELDFEICVYDEGFISGLFESFTGKPFTVQEIDCWCTGDRTCRFRAEVQK
jgi:uncharacterized protein